MQEFDYIVIGGGSAGCVITRRLIDAGYWVCLLEAGKKDKSPLIHIPFGMAAILPTKHVNWAFETEPQPGLNNRRGYQPRGKALGGSSSINAMLYVRGHKSDYDHWAALGNKGWGYDDVLPYFKKSENNEIHHDQYHGHGGLLNVTHQRSRNPFNDQFIKDAQLMQHPITDDFNGENQEGVCDFQVTQINGQRCSSAVAFLKPIINHPKLKVITDATSSRLLFDGKKCVGVNYIHEGQKKSVNAGAEIILAAGAFGTPQLLKLSGIGPAGQLKEHNIAVIHDLKGVGENLQDHIDYVAPFKAKSLDLFGYSLPGTLKMSWELIKYGFSRKGAFASSLAETGAFLKTDPSLSRADIQLHFICGLLDDHNRKLHWGHGFSCHVCLLRPKSVGTVGLHSINPFDPPKIDPKYFSERLDMDAMIKAYKMMDEILKGPNLSSFVTNDIYGANINSDAEIEQLLRQRSDTVYHPVGTAKMGTGSMAVVSPHDLKVHGIEGLRIADASVMPTIIGGNTNATTIMIAEKAAHMILKGQE